MRQSKELSDQNIRQDVLTPMGVITLPGVQGRLDHMAVDVAGKRLFVTGLENHSLEVVDLAGGKVIRSVGGIKEPQGVLYLPKERQILVCSRGDGTCRSFDAETFAEGPWVDLGTNADNIRLDTSSKTVYVGSGGEPGPGSLSAIDLASLLPRAKGGARTPQRSPADLLPANPGRFDPKATVELKSHPEAFQVSPDGKRAFVNMPDEHEVAVFDLTAGSIKLAASWPVEAEGNFPMVIDTTGSRLFVFCRKPAKVLCYNTRTGKVCGSADCVGDCDDAFYDADLGRLFVIGGEGFVDVFSVDPKTSTLARMSRLTTARRARTAFYVAPLQLLCVAAPAVEKGQQARILLFKVSPTPTGK
jgi:DNA-binding beta-propeller fold protein YncE